MVRFIKDVDFACQNPNYCRLCMSESKLRLNLFEAGAI
jgi:hypothetical protein